MLARLHHVAIIVSDYRRSLDFYTQILGFELISQNYRAERESWKAALGLNGIYLVELFSFPQPPPRLSYPEATGLRHLAFAVDNLASAVEELQSKGISYEPIRTDPITQKQFTFLNDPDGLPIELYEL